jgi:general secretion pathway protein K
MRLSKFFSQAKSPDGFIVVAVLWILGALATLATIYALYVRETANAFVVHDHRVQVQGLMLAGVELAVFQLTEVPQAQPAQGKFDFRLGTANVAVEFNSENARIDLNLAPKEVLAGLFIGLGVSRADAEGFANRIVAWRTRPSQATTESEVSLYRAAGLNHGPRHGPFQHVNEIALVLSLPANIIDRALPYLTVYSGRPEVNVLSAAPEVLAALPGMTPDRLQIMLSHRIGAPQDILRAQLGMAAQYATVQTSKANRVIVDVQLAGSRRVRSEAVVLLLDDDTEPFRVLSWRDDIGESPTDRYPNSSVR